MTKLMTSILMSLLLGGILIGQSDNEFLIKEVHNPIKSKFQLLKNNLYFSFKLPKSIDFNTIDTSLRVHLRTSNLQGFEDKEPKAVFDSAHDEYHVRISGLQQSITGEMYVRYSLSEGLKAMHLFSFNFYAPNRDNYNSKKLLQVYSKDGTIRVDFVNHNESILMPIVVATIDDLPAKLPAGFKQTSKVFQVSFIDKKTAAFEAYVSIFFEADKHDTRTRILQFNEKANLWEALTTQLHEEGANAPINKPGFFVLTEKN